MKRVQRLVPVVLLLAGALAVTLLVREAGLSAITAALAGAWPFFVGMVLLELATGALDALAVRSLHGAAGRRVPLRVWVRSSALALTSAELLPGGRVLGEVARATALAPFVSAPRAAAVAVRAHGTYLVVTAAATFVCYAFVSLDGTSPVLAGLLLFAGSVTGVLGALFLLGPRYGRVGRWLGGPRNIGRWLGGRMGLSASFGPRFEDALREGPVLSVRSVSLYALSRAVHVFGSLLALLAVGAACTASLVFASEGIALVAANTGDTVPGQAGVLEGAYRLFAPALGLGGAVAVALAAALLVRATRLTAAVFALGLSAPMFCSLERRALAALALLSLFGPAGQASAQDADPPIVETPKLIVRQRAVAVINPMGAEHMVGVGVRFPWDDGESPLLAGTHLELGVNTYTSPVYSMTGGYLQVSPLAFLVLRAELTAMTLWSIGMDGAGYYPVESYDADVSAQNFPATLGRIASGYNLQLSAILQGAIQLGPFRPIVFSQIMMEHERLGEEDFHYHPKYDLVLARSDFMIAVSSMALVELALSDTLGIRVGAYDDFRHVMASGATAHQLGGIAMLALDSRGSCLRELLAFGRVGAYLEPERRAGQATALVGLMVRYDLADL
jgi:hypothetical protein